MSFLGACFIFFLYLLFRESIETEVLRNNKEFSYDYEVINLNQSQPVLGDSTSVTKLDATNYNYRARVLDLYFKKNNSPLYGHGQDFVDACRKYNTPEDCTLLPAIARVETDLCKTDVSAKQFNCWGYGGSGPNRIIYKSFPQAIDSITGRLMSGYGERFFLDPEAGELFYCGSHCVTWGDKVKKVQKEIKDFARTNGYTM